MTMAGVFDAVIGTVTLAGVLGRSVERALELYKAPGEVKALQVSSSGFKALSTTTMG